MPLGGSLITVKAIHAQEDRAAARQKAEQVVAKLKEMKLADAAALVVAGIEKTLYYYAFPREQWRCLRTNNPLRLVREARRRTRAVGAFPDGKSAGFLFYLRTESNEPSNRGENLFTPATIKSHLHSSCLLAMSVWNDEEMANLAKSYGAMKLLDKGQLPSTLVPSIEECADQNGKAQKTAADFFSRSSPSTCHRAASRSRGNIRAISSDSSLDFTNEAWSSVTAWISTSDGQAVAARTLEQPRTSLRKKRSATATGQ